MIHKFSFQLEMLAGSSSAWSIAFSMLDKCQVTRQLKDGMMQSTPFATLGLENMLQEQYFLV